MLCICTTATVATVVTAAGTLLEALAIIAIDWAAREEGRKEVRRLGVADGGTWPRPSMDIPTSQCSHIYS